MRQCRHSAPTGNTIPEVMIATLLLGLFFASIFELNAVCLRYIEASKESVGAIAVVQDRTEVLRNLAFADLTNTSYVQTLLGSPANASDFAKTATEVVKLRAYPSANGVTQLTRHTNGSVSLDSSATSLGSTLVQLDVSLSWPAVLSGRARTEQTTAIISNGQKK